MKRPAQPPQRCPEGCITPTAPAQSSASRGALPVRCTLRPGPRSTGSLSSPASAPLCGRTSAGQPRCQPQDLPRLRHLRLAPAPQAPLQNFTPLGKALPGRGPLRACERGFVSQAPGKEQQPRRDFCLAALVCTATRRGAADAAERRDGTAGGPTRLSGDRAANACLAASTGLNHKPRRFASYPIL